MGYMQFSFLLFVCFCLLSFSSSIPHLCSKDESISLLKFKKSFILNSSASDSAPDPTLWEYTGYVVVVASASDSDECDYYGQKPYPKTSSWNMRRDCCSWDGVICDEITGHVIELDLSCSQLVGTIDSNSSLFQLSHLQRLDLSYNNFSNSHISPEFSRFSSLTHLNLSESSFSSEIASEITHLSKLQSLHLSTFPDSTKLRLATHDFKLLLQNLTQLRELDLTFINISFTIPLNFSSHLTTLRLMGTGLYGMLPECIFHLPNLEELGLGGNYQLSGYFPKTKWSSSASLMKLDLSFVKISDNLSESLGYLTSLHSLSLMRCNLRGPIPESLSNLTHIEYLCLPDNSLNGTIPSWMFSLPSLSGLFLNNSHLSG